VPDLCRADLQGALDLLETLTAHRGPEPFPLPVLRRLQDMTGADCAAGYVENGFDSRGQARQSVRETEPMPSWLIPLLERLCEQDPIDTSHCAHVTSPVAVSDFLTSREFRQRDVYRLVYRPLGIADSIRVYLPASTGCARFFFFDRSRFGFTTRTRKLLELLQPHLAYARARYDDHLLGTAGDRLTQREAEVMRWVARGASNAEIANRLWIAEHTVRKHVENVFTKLDVHTRTAAVARLHQF
jgi:DNA-binding CsgD family transcriptional regulator